MEQEPKTFPKAEPITQEPLAVTMGRRSEQTFTDSDMESGYHRETNECTDFCEDCVICFGVCDACCPSSGEGCLSTIALFLGNLCFACCKC